MKLAAAFLSIFLSLFALASPANADNCARTARSAAAARGAEVIRVRTVQQGDRTVCVITLRVPGAGGEPPRVETVRVGG